MNEPHAKYQSLSRCEAMDMHRQVEARVQTAHDDAQKAGFDCGVETTINRITAVDVDQRSCRVSGCKNFNRAFDNNCKENLTVICESYVSEYPSGGANETV